MINPKNWIAHKDKLYAKRPNFLNLYLVMPVSRNENWRHCIAFEKLPKEVQKLVNRPRKQGAQTR